MAEPNVAEEVAPGDAPDRRSRLRPSWLAIGGALSLLLCATTIFYLAFNVRREIEDLAVTNRDTSQWTLGQVEVELHALDIEVLLFLGGRNSDLKRVRQKFDIFYSRISTLSESPSFRQLREMEVGKSSLAALQAFLDRTTPLIDADDATLIESLPQVVADIEGIRRDAREFALAGIELFPAVSEAQRNRVAELLTYLALLTTLLVVFLVSLVVIMARVAYTSRKAEAAAAQSRARLQGVISTSLDAILVCDRNGVILDYNGAAELVFGYSREEALGAQMADLIIPDHLREAHETGMDRYRRTGKRRVVGRGLVQLEARRKSGDTFPAELSISSIDGANGEVFVSYIRDISIRQRNERDLISARDQALAGEKAKSEFLAVMSHEMRTPLNGLIGTMDLIRHTELSGNQEKLLELMETSGQILLNHINSVLDISKADAGKLVVISKRVNLRKVLRDLVDSQRHAIEMAGNEISLDFDHGVGGVWTDSFRLEQIILNLLGNANKFTHDGRIRVSARLMPDAKTVEISVKDSGIGIAPEDQDRIFEDFQTLDSSYGRRTSGSGLGLAIARRLATALNGSIGLKSELGKGSTFWVRLPVGGGDSSENEPVEAAGTRRNEPHEGGRSEHRTVRGMRVLLVEDNSINRTVARGMLAGLGHIVEEAEDGIKGVELAESTKFDLIMMDISMPGLDGVTAARRIRDGSGPNSGTPIVALTAHALAEDIVRFGEAGMTETLTKPVTRKDLSALVERIHRDGPGSGPGVAALPDTPVLDEVYLAELSESLGQSRFDAMLQEFLTETDTEFGTAPVNALAGDQASVVHKISGSAAVFGARAFQVALNDLEDALKEGRPAAELHQRALAAWTETRAQLEELMSE